MATSAEPATEISAPLQGITNEQAAARFNSDGPNELLSAKPRSFFRTIFEIIRQPMILLLLSAGAIYLLLGELRDSIILLGSIFAVIGIDLYQERKTEHALAALKNLSSPRAMVIRGGQQMRIAGRDVVQGDIVIVSEGDRVPADGVLLSALNLLVDESLLTGESESVRKTAATREMKSMSRPGGENLPCVFSGSMVVQGQGYARIMATGARTELGRIGKALHSIPPDTTRLQSQVSSMAKVMAIIGLSLCAIIAIVYGLTRESWINGLLAGITTAMALLPEEFPVVLTVFLALGAWRISQKKVLTKHGNAIEALGSATVLCVDKTGTLTQNRMQVQKLFCNQMTLDITPGLSSFPEQFHELLEYSILASKSNPLDPMEIAFQHFGTRFLSNTDHLHHDLELIHEYPLSSKLLAMTRVWKSPDDSQHFIAAKGAPEAIALLCKMPGDAASELAAQVALMAYKGLRVLGIAKCCYPNQSLPEHQQDLPFSFVGLVGLADPIRPEVPAAVRECYAAGIRVIMITGDYAGTAQSIARQAGIVTHDLVISGSDLDSMSDPELQARIRTTSLFARVVPEQKLRLVNALKAGGEIVAMTGDGVNDAPALKSAHVGIAMGERGTDVAREAADLVLLDDSFTSIVAAIRLGRRIFVNLQKALSFVFAVHVPIAGLALIPVLAQWPLVLMPVHIVFLELIIDPACSIAFEAEPGEPGIMQRPPRKPRDPLLSKSRILVSCLQGASVLSMVILVFAVTLFRGDSEASSRTLTFASLIIGNLLLILANRSWTRTILATLRAPNPALWWVIGAAFAILALVIYAPFFQSFFRFVPLHLIDLCICLASGIVSLIWFECCKIFQNKSTPR